MLSLRSSSIYCRCASIRYEINPSFAKQTYRAVGISSCVSNISKIPSGIYLDACSPLRITRTPHITNRKSKNIRICFLVLLLLFFLLSVDISTSLNRYAFTTLRTPKAHSSLWGTPAVQARYIDVRFANINSI